MKDASKILDKKQLQQKVNRLAWQVYERNYTQKEIVIVGIEKRGVVLSKRLANVISDISDLKVSSATISLDKDNPYSSEIIFSLDSKKIENKPM